MSTNHTTTADATSSNGKPPGGWAVFPCHSIVDGKCTCGRECHSPGKHPLTPNGLKNATSDRQQLAAWWQQWPQANIAVATGEGNGIVVIDIDKDKGGFESLAELEERYGRPPETVEAISGGGGRHLYYRYPAGVEVSSRNGWRPGIDVKASGGYVVCPPSNHTEGVYRWDEGFSPHETTLADIPDWLLELLPRKEGSPQPNADRFNSVYGSATSPLQRAQSYVAKAEAAGEGSRNDAAFRLAGHVAAFGLDEDSVCTLLFPWNLRCSPPLEESELRTCVASALKNGQPRPAKESANGGVGHGEAPREQQRPLFNKYTFAQLETKFPTLSQPVVNGLFREGEVCNIIGDSKSCKSWLAYGLSLSVLTGRDWLQRFPTSAGKVLLVDNELNPRSIVHRIPAVAAAAGIGPEFYQKDLDVWPLRGNLCSLQELAVDLFETEPGEYRLIILDAKYRFIAPGVSENENAAETHFYNIVDRIAAHTKAAIVLIHHSPKGNQSQKKVTDTGAGAGAQSRAADCHLVIRPHELDNVAVLEAAVRSFAPVNPIPVRWQFPLWLPETAADPEKLKGRQTRQQERQADADREAIRDITDVLIQGAATVSKISKATESGKPKVTRLLGIMRRQGTIDRRQTSVNGNECFEYYLTD